MPLLACDGRTDRTVSRLEFKSSPDGLDRLTIGQDKRQRLNNAAVDAESGAV